MTRDPRYDVLFESVKIGPKTAKNRFYQPPHCNAMGAARPHTHAAMRGVKAEGGWAVVNTEHCAIHPRSDMLPDNLQTIWDDRDIPALALMCEAVHEHGALAGVQLAYATYWNSNRSSREVPMGPMHRTVTPYEPVQARAMDKQDIRDLLRWWGNACGRAQQAGFDIINVDANFSTIAFQFLSPRNRRTDEYGGSIENRARLLKELIETSLEVVKGELAVTVRLIIDELIGEGGLQAHEDGRAVIEMLAELPDLWDLVVGDWAGDSPPSRFAGENIHESFVAFAKSVTTKPVVGVGRFTSPDTMVGLIGRGVLDMIGATRPSIADPFLPMKIKEGRTDDIRECIGCNICVSGQFLHAPIRCTQNPTMGEEWRKGWHPERIPPKGSDDTVLVVGAGPAGLEAARALGQRGYQVILAEATTELGGRVTKESRLPGLAEWARVRDWRIGQLHKLPNVEIYLDSRLTAAQVLEFGFQHVALATGAHWSPDGFGRSNPIPIPGTDRGNVFTPDDVIGGTIPEGPVVIFDDDHYYMANVLAEVLRAAGREVALVTPAPDIAAFTLNTLEMERIVRRLDEIDVAMTTHHNLAEVRDGEVLLRHTVTRRECVLPAASVLVVAGRLPDDALQSALMAAPEALAAAGVKSVKPIGDCHAPAAIVHATYAGHRYARELDVASDPDAVPFLREMPSLN
ncbi:MAG: FAD-dependent oxidoreductase [Rhodospirillaceae bacterium]|jgi:dimethylamine/trimethylamine dehydrogenase|nr:FAD-dependent oxidoreductase [Rhodospirillaceae bacterium]